MKKVKKGTTKKRQVFNALVAGTLHPVSSRKQYKTGHGNITADIRCTKKWYRE